MNYVNEIIVHELQQLEQAATEGPWRVDEQRGNVIFPACFFSVDAIGLTGRRLDMNRPDGTPIFTGQISNIARAQWEVDAAFITAMRNALPAILKQLTTARYLAAAVEKHLNFGEPGNALMAYRATEIP